MTDDKYIHYQPPEQIQDHTLISADYDYYSVGYSFRTPIGPDLTPWGYSYLSPLWRLLVAVCWHYQFKTSMDTSLLILCVAMFAMCKFPRTIPLLPVLY